MSRLTPFKDSLTADVKHSVGSSYIASLEVKQDFCYFAVILPELFTYPSWTVCWEIQDLTELSDPLSFSRPLILRANVQTKPGLCQMKKRGNRMLLFCFSTWSSMESSSCKLFGKLEPPVRHRELCVSMLCTEIIWTRSPIGKTLLLFKELLPIIALPSTEVSAAFWLPGCLALHWFIVLT